VYQTASVMRSVSAKARRHPKRVLYAEGEDDRVLQATQIVVDEGLARPLLLGRRTVIENAVLRLGLRVAPERDFDIVEPVDNPDHDLRAYLTKVLRRARSGGRRRDARRCRADTQHPAQAHG